MKRTPICKSHSTVAPVLHSRGSARESCTSEQAKETYKSYFPRFIEKGIQVGVLSSELKSFDLEFLGETINPERDLQFGYLGLQTLYDRYFLIDRNDSFSKEGKRIELPQIFFMRVAMGLAIRKKKE